MKYKISLIFFFYYLNDSQLRNCIHSIVECIKFSFLFPFIMFLFLFKHLFNLVFFSSNLKETHAYRTKSNFFVSFNTGMEKMSIM